MSNIIVQNIPPHTRCTNCGECCGPVPITHNDYARISNYLQGNGYAREVVRHKHKPLDCVFRDNELKKCAIYPVRPMVCRLFGVATHIYLQCPNGNSAQIDDMPFIAQDSDIYCVQNDIDWTKITGDDADE